MLALLSSFNGCGKKAAAPRAADPESTRTFDKVGSYLDQGGDIYLYLRTEQVFDRVPAAMDEWKTALSAAAGQDLPMTPEQVDVVFDFAQKAVMDTGILQLRAVGLSGIKMEEGLSRAKTVAYSGERTQPGLLWRMGGKDAPHPIAALDFLPATTAYAAFCDFDPKVVWEFVQQIASEIPDPQVQAQVQTLPVMAEQALGMSLSDLLASIDTEFGVVITADESETMTVPISNSAMEMPRVAIAVLIRVNDDKLYDMITGKVEAALGPMAPMTKSDVGGVRMLSAQVPETGFPIKPTIARFGKYLVIATSDELVKQLARTGPEHPALLKDTEEFKRFARLEKMEANAFAYLTERGAGMLRRLQLHSFESDSDIPATLKPNVEKLYDLFSQKFFFALGRLEKDAFVTTAYSDKGSDQMVAAVAIVPVAIAAAVAVPAMLKVKERAGASE
jgi:hypothetical protein